jgi:hypothetical protein
MILLLVLLPAPGGWCGDQHVVGGTIYTTTWPTSRAAASTATTAFHRRIWVCWIIIGRTRRQSKKFKRPWTSWRGVGPLTRCWAAAMGMDATRHMIMHYADPHSAIIQLPVLLISKSWAWTLGFGPLSLSIGRAPTDDCGQTAGEQQRLEKNRFGFSIGLDQPGMMPRVANDVPAL